jgi:POT family proton-dependent oligopeptide transporter
MEISLALWSYVTPLLGAYIAERYWGRFRTIQIAFVIAFTGHFFLIISAIPPVITDPNSAIACFSVGIVLIGIGVGGFKSNLLVLIAEQCSMPFPH